MSTDDLIRLHMKLHSAELELQSLVEDNKLLLEEREHLLSRHHLDYEYQPGHECKDMIMHVIGVFVYEYKFVRKRQHTQVNGGGKVLASDFKLDYDVVSGLVDANCKLFKIYKHNPTDSVEDIIRQAVFESVSSVMQKYLVDI